MAELRRLASRCEFGVEYRDDALRDRLVCGLRSGSIQKKLLTTADLTLALAIEIAQGMEAADLGAKKFQDTTEGVVQKMDVKHESEKSSHSRDSKERVCYRCGLREHLANTCRFRDAECRRCQKRGHIARMCRSTGVQNPRKPPGSKPGATRDTKWVQVEEDDDEEDNQLPVFKLGQKASPPIVVTMEVEGIHLPMEVDTGTAVSVISARTKEARLPAAVMKKSGVVLTTYSGEQMKVAGKLEVRVKYGELFTLYVVEGAGPTLVGRDWLRQIRYSIGLLSKQQGQGRLEDLLELYSAVFQEEVGVMNTFEAHLQLKPESVPKFHKHRPVPFAIKQAIEDELDRLEKAGIIEKVTHSQWASPIVPVPKGDGRIRLCGDYKATLNSSLEVDQYPLPRPEDIFASLAGGQKFTTLDLTNAYQQMKLDLPSRELVTINTHRGLYRYTRLPFGVASAPALFQKTMDTVLQGLPHVACYIDDILITGENDQEHLQNVEETLRRLQEYNIRAKKVKCAFMQDSVTYLGHKVDSQGLHPTSKKVEAVLEAPQPQTLQELKSFLGLIHYYGKFMPNLATVLHPLNQLLRADTKWKWTSDCTEAFEAAKKMLASAPVLVHYNPELPLRVAGDASSYGIGAVMSHVFPDGTEHPVAFASRTLTSCEQNYAQLEKEALSLIFAINKFHTYLYGRKFTLITDNEPLAAILGPKKGVPPLAAA